MQNIRELVMEWVDKYDAMARSMYPEYARRPKPSVEFFMKGRVNGQACYREWKIRLNLHVASQKMNEFENTVSHEIAHMIDVARRGRSGHDRIWKMIHRSLGGTGTRCSEYKAEYISARSKNEYLYQNANGAIFWCGPKYHAKFQRNQLSWVTTRSNRERFVKTDFTGQSRTV